MTSEIPLSVICLITCISTRTSSMGKNCFRTVRNYFFGFAEFYNYREVVDSGQMYHRHYLVVFITYYFSRCYCYFKYLCLCLVDVNAYCTCAHISSTKYRAKEGRGYCEDFRLLSSYLVAIHCTIYFTFFFYCYSIYLLFYCYVNSLSTRSFS